MYLNCVHSDTAVEMEDDDDFDYSTRVASIMGRGDQQELQDNSAEKAFSSSAQGPGDGDEVNQQVPPPSFIIPDEIVMKDENDEPPSSSRQQEPGDKETGNQVVMAADADWDATLTLPEYLPETTRIRHISAVDSLSSPSPPCITLDDSDEDDKRNKINELLSA